MVPVLHLLVSFLRETKLFKLCFSCSIFLSILFHVTYQPCGCSAERIKAVTWVGRERELSIIFFFFLSYMAFLVVYFPSRTLTGWKQHLGYWEYVLIAIYCVLPIFISSRQIAFECKISLNITTKEWIYKMSNVVFLSMILTWSSMHQMGLWLKWSEVFSFLILHVRGLKRKLCGMATLLFLTGYVCGALQKYTISHPWLESAATEGKDSLFISKLGLGIKLCIKGVWWELECPSARAASECRPHPPHGHFACPHDLGHQQVCLCSAERLAHSVLTTNTETILGPHPVLPLCCSPEGGPLCAVMTEGSKTLLVWQAAPYRYQAWSCGFGCQGKVPLSFKGLWKKLLYFMLF